MERNELAQKETEEVMRPICPYTTSIVTVQVGPDDERKQYFVHSGILSHCAELSTSTEREITLSDTDPAIFELALRFLYTGHYQCYSSTTPRPTDGHTKASEFETHSLLYCFASRYKLDTLVPLTIKNIEGLRQVPYMNILDTAKKIYHKLPEDDLWYRGYFKNETRNAVRENMDLVQESWILDVFRERYGDFTVDLFSTLMDGVRSENTPQCSPPATVLTPTTPTSINYVTRMILAEDGYEQCPYTAEHLKKEGAKYLWESCSRCMKDRQMMLEKLQKLDIDGGFSAYCDVRSAGESNAADIATASPEVHNRRVGSEIPAAVEGSEAAETHESDISIFEQHPRVKDGSETEPATGPVDDGIIPDILQGPPQEIRSCGEPVGYSRGKKKDRKRRKRCTEDAPLVEAAPSYCPIPEEPSQAAHALSWEFPRDSAREPPAPLVLDPGPVAEHDFVPLDLYQEPSPNEATSATEQEPERDPWSAWGLTPKKSRGSFTGAPTSTQQVAQC